jgi:hypothetical protein
MRDKQALTRELILHLPEAHGMSFNHAMSRWWFNLRKSGGMRLTGLGYHDFVKYLDLEHHNFVIQDPTTFRQQTILDLDRKLQTPYYVSAHKGIPQQIIFFGSKEAVMANLYGNLNQFLSNYHP